ncbi:MAG TPA: hypothetical protein DD435_04635 [Cyanobacteria bacterium UBA8530]|nr:hypothetical protein [Cyanobacteria bacterium UBA8530]
MRSKKMFLLALSLGVGLSYSFPTLAAVNGETKVEINKTMTRGVQNGQNGTTVEQTKNTFQYSEDAFLGQLKATLGRVPTAAELASAAALATLPSDDRAALLAQISAGKLTVAAAGAWAERGLNVRPQPSAYFAGLASGTVIAAVTEPWGGYMGCTVMDNDSNLYELGGMQTSLVKISASGVRTDIPLPAGFPNWHPRASLGADGKIYFTGYDSPMIGTYDPKTGQFTTRSVPSNAKGGIVADASGNIFIEAVDRILKVTPAGVVSTLESGLITHGNIAMDITGRYILGGANSAGKIYKIDKETGATTTIAYTNVPNDPATQMEDRRVDLMQIEDGSYRIVTGDGHVYKVPKDGGSAVLVGQLPRDPAGLDFWTTIAADAQGGMYSVSNGKLIRTVIP